MNSKEEHRVDDGDDEDEDEDEEKLAATNEGPATEATFLNSVRVMLAKKKSDSNLERKK